MEKNDIVGLIKDGLKIIQDEQEEDGGFATLSAGQSDFSDAKRFVTTFAASNILRCLSAYHGEASEEMVKNIKKRIAEFLLKEKSENWSWNYWSRSSYEYHDAPYPDDLDDTFSALNALVGFDPKHIDGTALASIMKLLMMNEKEPGGPYKTWLMPKGESAEKNDIDIVVNAGIQSFLSEFGIILPKLKNFIEEAITAGKLQSPYYPGVAPIVYAISQGRTGSEGFKLLESIFNAVGRDGLWGDPLQTAMCISALINLGYRDSITDDEMENFIRTIKDDEFAPHPFCFDPSRNGEKQYAGSRALTAAFIVEALWKLIAEPSKREVGAHNPYGYQTLRKIRSLAKKEMAELPNELKSLAIQKVNTMQDPEVVLLSRRTWQAIDPMGVKKHGYFIQKLALGSLYGWMAYDIYDDILDGEGKVKDLSMANVFMRNMQAIWDEFSYGFKLLEFSPMFQFGYWMERLCETVDNANLWESAHARLSVVDGKVMIPEKFPEGILRRAVDRSIGYALPAIAVAIFIDAENTELPKALLSFIRNYLAARQWHDDAHDWQNDLSAGRLTPVTMRLLEWWKDQHPGQPLDLQNDLVELRRRFWNVEIENIIKEIRAQIKKARDTIESLLEIADPSQLTSMLKRLEDAAVLTLREREEAIKFFEAY